MKKIVLSLFMTFTVVFVYGQTIVSTTPENKKVILEEFTGVNCGFCPQGHAIAKAFQDANPGNVFLVNIHSGGFANPGAGQPDFRTAFGQAIDNQSNLVGYPAGTINRTAFPGLSQSGNPAHTAMGRGNWVTAGNQTLTQASYVNMAVEAELDVITRELTVHVEAFYTASSPVATNKLNIALLQNNTLGPQAGGNMGNNYVHMHRLVHLITGQWGVDVTNTSTSSFIDETFTYTVPADYRSIPVEIQDLELVVFMAETTQTIISGNGTFPTYVNLPANDAAIDSTFEYEEQCGIDFAPTVTIQNTGADDLTSLDITYSINGGPDEVFTWTGSLSTFESEDVILDPIPYTIQASNTVDFSLPTDANASNNTASNTFDQLTDENTNSLNLRISTDANADEITWNIINIDGDVVASGGPYTSGEIVDINFNVPDIGCHLFTVFDSGGDGDYFIRLRDSENDLIFFINSEFGSQVSKNFNTNGILNTNSNLLNEIAIFPNPSNSFITIANAETANIVMFDILGRTVHTQNTISSNQQIDVSKLQSGTYFVQVEIEGAITVKKLVVNK